MTLLETLLALAIVLALGSVVVVSMDRSLTRGQFERGGDLLDEHVRLARAHASRTGEAVEIVFDLDRRMLIARRFMLESDARTFDASSAFNENPDVAAMTDEGFVALTDVRTIEEPWAEQPWPEICGVHREDPRARMSSGELFEVVSDAGVDAEFESLNPFDANEIRFTVLLPDGTAAKAEPVFLWDGDRRLRKITIDPWIGVLRAERLSMDDVDASAWAGASDTAADAAATGAGNDAGSDVRNDNRPRAGAAP
jgi:hypothetical protein